MSKSKCKNFSDEFKDKVAMEGIRGIKTVNVVARYLVNIRTGWFVEEGIRASGANTAM